MVPQKLCSESKFINYLHNYVNLNEYAFTLAWRFNIVFK